MAKQNSTAVEKTKRKYSVTFDEPSLTKQHFKSETNINTIMSRYEKQGIVDHINKHKGTYGEFADIPDYQEALNKMKLAEEMFMELPSRVRNYFQNDPVQFVEFVQNPANEGKLVEIGLAKAKPVSDAQASTDKQVVKETTKKATAPSQGDKSE